MVRIDALHTLARISVLGTALLALTLTASLVHAQKRGMDMDQVRDVRGEPTEIKGPVGNPPITQWIYAGDILYFEYDKLLEIVPKDNKPQLLRRDGLRSDTVRDGSHFYYK